MTEEEQQLSFFEKGTILVKSTPNSAECVDETLRDGSFLHVRGGRDYMVRNALGEFVPINIVNPVVQNAYRDKWATANCPDCPRYIGRQAAIEVITFANSLNPRHRLRIGSSFTGLCLWGTYPKLLVERDAPRRCEYFGKTAEDYAKKHPSYQRSF